MNHCFSRNATSGLAVSLGERGQQRACGERIECIPRRPLVLFKLRISESLGGRSLFILLFFVFGSSCVSQVVLLGRGQTIFRAGGEHSESARLARSAHAITSRAVLTRNQTQKAEIVVSSDGSLNLTAYDVTTPDSATAAALAAAGLESSPR